MHRAYACTCRRRVYSAQVAFGGLQSSGFHLVSQDSLISQQLETELSVHEVATGKIPVSQLLPVTKKKKREPSTSFSSDANIAVL